MTKIFHLLKKKPIKEDNSKSYRPLALLSVSTVHLSIKHVCTKFQFFSFLSSGENCEENFHLLKNPIKADNFASNGPLALILVSSVPRAQNSWSYFP